MNIDLSDVTLKPRQKKTSDKRSILIRMTFSQAGTFNLPVELWRSIWKLVEDSVVYPYTLKNELSIKPSTYGTLSCEASEDSVEVDNGVRSSLFKIRATIVCVCRSWYFMGVSPLWSHVRIYGFGQNLNASSIWAALVQNRTLSTYIRRLSIETKSEAQWPQPRSQVPDEAAVLVKILSRLSSLKIISYPICFDVGDLPRDIYPEVVILTHSKYDAHWKSGIGYRMPLARYAHTISLNNLNYMTIATEDGMKYSFPNLVNLRMRIVSNDLFESIANSWSFPVLRSLSVLHSVSHNAAMGVMLQKQRLTLEKVELTIKFANHCDLVVEMPELSLLSFHCIGYFGNIEAVGWLRCIKAPRLRCFALSLINGWYNPTVNPSEVITEALCLYPAVKDIILMVTDRAMAFSNSEDMWKKSVTNWCKGKRRLELRIQKEGSRIVYTRENLAGELLSLGGDEIEVLTRF